MLQMINECNCIFIFVFTAHPPLATPRRHIDRRPWYHFVSRFALCTVWMCNVIALLIKLEVLTGWPVFVLILRDTCPLYMASHRVFLESRLLRIGGLSAMCSMPVFFAIGCLFFLFVFFIPYSVHCVAVVFLDVSCVLDGFQ